MTTNQNGIPVLKKDSASKAAFLSLRGYRYQNAGVLFGADDAGRSMPRPDYDQANDLIFTYQQGLSATWSPHTSENTEMTEKLYQAHRSKWEALENMNRNDPLFMAAVNEFKQDCYAEAMRAPKTQLAAHKAALAIFAYASDIDKIQDSAKEGAVIQWRVPTASEFAKRVETSWVEAGRLYNAELLAQKRTEAAHQPAELSSVSTSGGSTSKQPTVVRTAVKPSRAAQKVSSVVELSGKKQLTTPGADVKVAAWQEAMSSYAQKHDLNIRLKEDGVWGEATGMLFEQLGGETDIVLGLLSREQIKLHPENFEVVADVARTETATRQVVQLSANSSSQSVSAAQKVAAVAEVSGKKQLTTPGADVKVAAWQEAMDAYAAKHDLEMLPEEDGAWGEKTDTLFKKLGGEAKKVLSLLSSDKIKLHPEHFEVVAPQFSQTKSAANIKSK